MTELNRELVPLRLKGIEAKMPGFSLTASFEVGVGERIAIVAPSGSGKTTLLRMIAGLSPVAAGRIFLGNDEVTSLPPERREMGFVFQEQALFPSLTVLENAAFGLRMKGLANKQRNAVARDWLERVGLLPLAGSSVSHLSGGERQRVSLVRAIAWKPRLLLLDEPFSALDASLRASVRQSVLDLHALWPAPLILVTHDQADIEALATDRVRYVEETGGHRRFFR